MITYDIYESNLDNNSYFPNTLLCIQTLKKHYLTYIDNIVSFLNSAKTSDQNILKLHINCIIEKFRLTDLVLKEFNPIPRHININQEIIAELSLLSKQPIISHIKLLKILSQYKIPNVDRIDFKIDNNTICDDILLEIEFPQNLVPICYKNRGNSKCHLKTDTEWQSEIELFTKKSEWLFYNFQHMRQYHELYRRIDIRSLLNDKELTYNDFIDRVRTLINLSENNIINTSLLPPKYILSLFSQYNINVLYPTSHHYQRLIRSLCRRGDSVGLSRLLDSPYLDLSKIDLYAINRKGQNSLSYIEKYSYKNPESKIKYDCCKQILLAHQQPKEIDLPPDTFMLSKLRSFLPMFSCQTVATATAAATIGVGIMYKVINELEALNPQQSHHP